MCCSLLKWDAPKNDLTAAKAALVKRLTRLGATPAGAWKVAFGAYERHRRLAEVTQGSGVATSDAAQKRAIATGELLVCVYAGCGCVVFAHKTPSCAERDAHMRVLRLNDDARPFFLAAGQQLPIQADAALEAVLISSVSVCELRFEGTIEVGHQHSPAAAAAPFESRGSFRFTLLFVVIVMQGHQYAVGDFTVSVGSLKLRGSYRAVIVEVNKQAQSTLVAHHLARDVSSISLVQYPAPRWNTSHVQC